MKNRLTYKRNHNHLSSIVNNQTVIVDLESEKIYFLNNTSEFIWNLLEDEKTLLEITTEMQEAFNVSKKIVEKDVSYILNKYDGILFSKTKQ